MRFVSLDRKSLSASVTFGDGDHTVTKVILGDAPNRLQILRKIREAKRDFLFALYGEDWKNHDPTWNNGLWSTEPFDDELEVFEKVIDEISKSPS